MYIKRIVPNWTEILSNFSNINNSTSYWYTGGNKQKSVQTTHIQILSALPQSVTVYTYIYIYIFFSEVCGLVKKIRNSFYNDSCKKYPVVVVVDFFHVSFVSHQLLVLLSLFPLTDDILNNLPEEAIDK